MATVQHPAPRRVEVHHNFDWLWISLSVILVALIAGAIAWAIFRPAVEVPPLLDEVTGFEIDHEVTAMKIAAPGVTTPYFGYSGELMPGTEMVASVVQITDPGEAASLMRSVDRAIAVSNWALIGAFDLDHEATPGHVATPGVTTDYFGFNPVLDPDK
ncbi:MAG: hypothetical protein ABFR89_07590 [Actinomycetota bacterium]